METFGEWLRGQRNVRNLTRGEFAKCVGCSVAMLSKIENDERRSSNQLADLMANCLGVPLKVRSTVVSQPHKKQNISLYNCARNLTRN